MLKEYSLIEDCGKSEKLKNSYFEFIAQIFPSISFNKWNDLGYWTHKYIPHAFMIQDKIISNVSVAKMELVINGQIKKCIQIGAVGTLPEYRNNGLSRDLMKYILTKYENETDIFYLFANETVLDFYPKFNFIAQKEYSFKWNGLLPQTKVESRKLNINESEDLKIINNIVSQRIPVSNILGIKNAGDINMWHLINLYNNDLYYLPNENAIIIARYKDGKVQIIDCISKIDLDIFEVVSKLFELNEKIEIEFKFTPDKFISREKLLIEEADSHLFTLGDYELSNEKVMYPVTSQT